jgi:hypothetical protein
MALNKRAAIYVTALLALNVYVAWNLFWVEYTDNMRTNAGSFLAISRFTIEHFPHLHWFPFWFNGLPFENAYTPLLHLVDAATAWMTGISPARAYNFVTGLFYTAGPVFLFALVWRVTNYLETSFFAAAIYSLFSPAALFPVFRPLGSAWNGLRLNYLVYWGEGPHIATLAVFPIALLAAYMALTTRRYRWHFAASVFMAATVLLNAFGAVDLALGCACLVLALPRKQIPRAALAIVFMAIAAYCIAIPFLHPELIRTISDNSQHVDGDFSRRRLMGAQLVALPGIVCVWAAARWIQDYFLRFGVMLAYVLFEIIGMYAVANFPVMPQPHRYAIEFELAACIVIALTVRLCMLRLSPVWRTAFCGVLLIAGVHQIVRYHKFARQLTKPIDIAQTEDYRVAKWLDAHLGGTRVFVSGETGTWLNAFTDVPQMNSGHQPFDPNFHVNAGAIYAIYSGMNAGDRDAENSIFWLKAFGCHAIHVARSRLYGEIFQHPHKFEGVLPVLWRDEEAVIYGIPQRTKSLAHVVPEGALVKRDPINGLDTSEVERYDAALDDPSLPDDVMEWPAPDRGHIQTTLHPGQALSIQVSYDSGWIAFANGRRTVVSRDGIGLSAVHAECDGPCTVDFIFDGGWQRKLYRALSGLTLLAGIAGWFASAYFSRRKFPTKSVSTPEE